jgi:hypothetical protein
MPLQSQLFSANPRLRSCLFNDADHVAPGASGEHVELIQAALIRFRFLDPALALAEMGTYGRNTAAAVLAYKQVFGIVNFSYQTAADNIVGKMTIASLDSNMCALEAIDFLPSLFPWPLESHAVNVFGRDASAPSMAFAAVETTASLAVVGTTGAVGTPTDPFFPPLSELPQDMQETIRRSNLAKVPGTPSMYPFVANHEGPLDGAELSKRFGKFSADKGLLLEIYNRMRPFGIWSLIKTIRATYFGIGARGMFCHPFDHAKAFAFMQALATGPTRPANPVLADISKAIPVTDSKFCKDAFNVHGERDSWREIVDSGPGLHICVTNASGRARTDENYPASDFHIDAVQQGQFCSNGVCIPLVNGQTIGHLQTVGPWLLEQPGDWLKKHSPF